MMKSGVRSLGIVILLALALSACWLQAGGNAANSRTNGAESGITPKNVASLGIAWRTPVDSHLSEPLVSGGKIYVTVMRRVGTGENVDVLGAQAYDATTGALLWDTSLLPTGGGEGAGRVETPTLLDGALWVPYWHQGLGSCAGRLARLDPGSGAVLSSDPTGIDPSSLTADAGHVAYTEWVCGGGADRLVVRNAATRAIEWTAPFGPAATAVAPTIAGGRVFVRNGNAVEAYPLAGCGAAVCPPTWTKAMPPSSLFWTRPATAGNSVVLLGRSSVTPQAETVVVLDAATGDVRWEAEVRGTPKGLAVANGTVYVTRDAAQATLDAYPLAGCGEAVCKPRWFTTFGATAPGEPTLAGGVVYVPLESRPSTAPAIAAVDAEDCGAGTCPELTRVPFIPGPGPFPSVASPYVTSVGEGQVLVGWSPGVSGGGEASQLIALEPGVR